MKFTFSTPNWQCAERCEKPRFITVKADNEERARELAMIERWGPLPRFGLARWHGYGLILEDRSR